MRKRNKLFDTWRKQVDVRICKQLNEWFGEPPEGSHLRPVVLRVDTAPFPEEFKPSGKITWKEFENVILPRAYEDDIGSVYLDIVTELKKLVIDTHPDRHAVATTMRKSGLSIEQLLLEKVYCETEVTLELGNIIDTLDVDIIPEFEDVHIRTKDPVTGPQKLDKELIRNMYHNAVERLISVRKEGKDLDQVWIRPIKGNNKERLIVHYRNGEFEMYYKSFPNYCCICSFAEGEDELLEIKKFAKIFINSVYKHYWPEVTNYLDRWLSIN